MTVQEKDARLYELDINEGDKVFLIEGKCESSAESRGLADAALKRCRQIYAKDTKRWDLN